MHNFFYGLLTPVLAPCPGFTIPGETIHYNVPITILSMFIAVGIVCAGPT